MICDLCKTIFVSGNRPDGTPNGVAFVLEDGNKITLCSFCVERVGRGEKKAMEFLEGFKNNDQTSL